MITCVNCEKVQQDTTVCQVCGRYPHYSYGRQISCHGGATAEISLQLPQSYTCQHSHIHYKTHK